MSLSTLLNSVVSLTSRPDARNTISLTALNSLILEIVTNNDYPDDLVETVIVNPTPENAAASLSLDITGYPGVRKIEYVVANDRPLRSISPRNALSSQGCPQVDCFYKSGNTLVVNASRAFDSVRIGYYQQVIPLAEVHGEDSHWLIDQYEAMLINATVARTFQATGDDTSAAYYEQLYRDQRKQIRAGLAESE